VLNMTDALSRSQGAFAGIARRRFRDRRPAASSPTTRRVLRRESCAGSSASRTKRRRFTAKLRRPQRVGLRARLLHARRAIDSASIADPAPRRASPTWIQRFELEGARVFKHR
jgi:hypothetical protein